MSSCDEESEKSNVVVVSCRDRLIYNCDETRFLRVLNEKRRRFTLVSPSINNNRCNYRRTIKRNYATNCCRSTTNNSRFHAITSHRNFGDSSWAKTGFCDCRKWREIMPVAATVVDSRRRAAIAINFSPHWRHYTEKYQFCYWPKFAKIRHYRAISSILLVDIFLRIAYATKIVAVGSTSCRPGLYRKSLANFWNALTKEFLIKESTAKTKCFSKRIERNSRRSRRRANCLYSKRAHCRLVSGFPHLSLPLFNPWSYLTRAKISAYRLAFSDAAAFIESSTANRRPSSGARRPAPSGVAPTTSSCRWTLTAFLLLLLLMVPASEPCSTRPSPKPRPVRPFWLPKVVITRENCTEDYARLYCLNGGLCSRSRLNGNYIVTCQCASGWSGRRCEYNDVLADDADTSSDRFVASPLVAAVRPRVQAASISDAVGALIVLTFVLTLIAAACNRRQRQRRRRASHNVAAVEFLPTVCRAASPQRSSTAMSRRDLAALSRTARRQRCIGVASNVKRSTLTHCKDEALKPSRNAIRAEHIV